jgi:DNA-directed RNA polymerase subunit M/transcription elongation factor TFIIS
VDFCSECGSRLVPRKVNLEKQTRLMFACASCGRELEEQSESVKIKDKLLSIVPSSCFLW